VCIPHKLSGPFPPSANSPADLWFCPSHFCTSCGALESCKQKIEVFPLEVITTGAHLSGGVDLQHCASCPFSTCLSCVADMGVSRSRGSSGGGGTGVFRSLAAYQMIANEVKLPQAAAALALSMKSSKKVMH
jgi:hypothetical protein